MNLTYARWLKLPIQTLNQPWKLFNVDGTENKTGALHYYVDLSLQTGGQRTNHRFYLSDLDKNNIILGYPWFATSQPRIDWARGWIDSAQLPIILRTTNATKARFVPRTRNVPRAYEEEKIYCIIRHVEDIPQDVNPFNIVPENLAKIPTHYHKHLKVFSEAKAR
jgi:hypothetical protein